VNFVNVFYSLTKALAEDKGVFVRKRLKGLKENHEIIDILIIFSDSKRASRIWQFGRFVFFQRTKTFPVKCKNLTGHYGVRVVQFYFPIIWYCFNF